MVEDDQVVMMDVVENQVVHLAVYASHHLAYHHCGRGGEWNGV